MIRDYHRSSWTLFWLAVALVCVAMFIAQHSEVNVLARYSSVAGLVTIIGAWILLTRKRLLASGLSSVWLLIPVGGWVAFLGFAQAITRGSDNPVIGLGLIIALALVIALSAGFVRRLDDMPLRLPPINRQ